MKIAGSGRPSKLCKKIFILVTGMACECRINTQHYFVCLFVFGIRYSVFRTRYSVFGIWFCIRYSVFGTRYSVLCMYLPITSLRNAWNVARYDTVVVVGSGRVGSSGRVRHNENSTYKKIGMYSPGIRYSVFGTRYSVLGIRYSVFGTRYSVFGTLVMGFGTDANFSYKNSYQKSSIWLWWQGQC